MNPITPNTYIYANQSPTPVQLTLLIHNTNAIPLPIHEQPVGAPPGPIITTLQPGAFTILSYTINPNFSLFSPGPAAMQFLAH
jgi:hypothetical protein